jgi:hypothetical protein
MRLTVLSDFVHSGSTGQVAQIRSLSVYDWSSKLGSLRRLSAQAGYSMGSLRSLALWFRSGIVIDDKK